MNVNSNVGEGANADDKLMSLFESALQRQRDHEENEFPEVLSDALGKRVDGAPELSLSECHVLATIGSDADASATAIASALGMTRGGVSKIIGRLERKGCVRTAPKAGNKREVCLALTPLGRRVFDVHEELHTARRSRMAEFLGRFSADEKEVLGRFLEELSVFE